jgi:GcrA cell cycle regulator
MEATMVSCERSIELLKVFWADGHSASTIAARINARLGTSFSRSAVIGKKHRLKLSDRISNKIHPRVPVEPLRLIERPRRTFTIKPPTEPRRVPSPDAQSCDSNRKAAGLTNLADLGDSDCRWPIGDPRTDDFGFCAVKTVPEQTYCPHHARRASQQITMPIRLRPAADRPYAPSKSKKELV